MSHIPEEELVLYAVQSGTIASGRHPEIEAHLATCAECQETHDFLVIRDEGEVDAALREEDTWEPIFGSATYDALMEHGARIAEEDREAEELLRPYLEHPIRIAWDALTTKRRYRTGGVVRKLNAAAHANYKNKPRVALTFADAAISIAELLPEDVYPARAVYQLRGAAWKERANALMILGEFPQAHDSLDRAQRAYAKTAHSGLGLSIVALVRAGLFGLQGRLDEALAMAERAERGFAHVGDEKRRMDAAFLRGGIMFEAGDPSDALTIFRRIIAHGENTRSAQWIALGSYAAANCEVDRMNLGEASLLFHGLTRQDVAAVRTFLQRAERQPSLQFVPPPRPPEDRV